MPEPLDVTPKYAKTISKRFTRNLPSSVSAADFDQLTQNAGFRYMTRYLNLHGTDEEILRWNSINKIENSFDQRGAIRQFVREQGLIVPEKYHKDLFSPGFAL